MSEISNVDRLKIILRENDCPFFTEDELEFYLKENDNDFNKAAYQCLILKSENTSLSISGMQAADASSYFRRIAQKYRGNNTGYLGGQYA